MEHVATREDIAKVETLIERKEATMLRWLLGILAVAGVGLVVALIRVFALAPGRIRHSTTVYVPVRVAAGFRNRSVAASSTVRFSGRMTTPYTSRAVSRPT